MADVNDVVEKVEPEVEEPSVEPDNNVAPEAVKKMVEEMQHNVENNPLFQNIIKNSPYMQAMNQNQMAPQMERPPVPDPEKDNTITCINIAPVYSKIVERKDKDNEKIAIMYYLCIDSFGQLFTINKAFNINSEEEQLDFECLPFAEFDTDHFTRKIQNRWLSIHLPRYTSDLKFYIDDINNPCVYIYGIKANDGNKFKIILKNDVFASLLFLDDYPLNDGVESDHDLDFAISNGAVPCKYEPDFFIVDDLDIISMADATIRPTPSNIIEKIKNKFSRYELVSTNIALITKLYSFSKDNKESIQLLTPFDVGVVYDDSKYKGTTVDNIEDGYFVDGDQYVSNLIVIDARIYGIDKSYMIIRATNKNKQPKIILFDDNMKNILNNKINEY